MWDRATAVRASLASALAQLGSSEIDPSLLESLAETIYDAAASDPSNDATLAHGLSEFLASCGAGAVDPARLARFLSSVRKGEVPAHLGPPLPPPGFKPPVPPSPSARPKQAEPKAPPSPTPPRAQASAEDAEEEDWFWGHGGDREGQKNAAVAAAAAAAAAASRPRNIPPPSAANGGARQASSSPPPPQPQPAPLPPSPPPKPFEPGSDTDWPALGGGAGPSHAARHLSAAAPSWVPPKPAATPAAPAATRPQPVGHSSVDEAPGGEEEEETGDMPADVLFDFLQQQFPSVPASRVYDILYDSAFDVLTAVETLQHYVETGGHPDRLPGGGSDAGGGAHAYAHAAAPPPPAPPVQLVLEDESAFPSLGAAKGRSGAGGGGSKGGAAPVVGCGDAEGAAGLEDDFVASLRLAASQAASARGQVQGEATGGRGKELLGRGRGRGGAGAGGGGGGGRGKHGFTAPYMETGEAVSRQYAEARAVASDHARARNQCYMQATQAYLSGNKALAKELAAQGRHHADLMAEAHDAAASTILTDRNTRAAAALSTSPSGLPLLDLHGLHVTEALQALEAEVSGGARKGRPLLVLVGVGKHTKVLKARLPVAVEGFLGERGVRWQYVEEGLIRVEP